MQQEWDDLDELIKDSSAEIDTKSNYNYKLISRINSQKRYSIQMRQKNIAAISFIMAGFMLMFIYTSDIKYRVADMEFHVKTSISAIKYDLNINNFFSEER